MINLFRPVRRQLRPHLVRQVAPEFPDRDRNGASQFLCEITLQKLLGIFFGGHAPRLGPAPQSGFLFLRKVKG